jgi:hypothetical protein
MDPNFRIYEAPKDEIPAEDKARLAGYLKGRSDEERERRIRELLAREEAKQAVKRSRR